MNPVSTSRFRRLTGLSAVAVAAVTILTTASYLTPDDALVLPIKVALLGGSTVVQNASAEALNSGVTFGEGAVSVDQT